ncbi:MAG: DUF488 family protein [Candidatus Korobacteraceae bacterium]
MTVALKRVYAQPSPHDGTRVLVDRLWPRGLKKADAALDAWLRDLAPSNELRKWFHTHPQQWSKFRERYLKELTTEAANAALQQLYELQKKRRRLTLLFASKNEERNNALVLKQLIDGGRKPPTGTGPIRAVATKRGRAARPSPG